MQQFFTENFQLSLDQIRQCKQVLRMRQGDVIRVVDAHGSGFLASFDDDSLETITLNEPIVWSTPTQKVTLIQSMIRNERLEWMLQKSVELGVDTIVLYRADHGVVKDYGKREDRKMARFQEIVKEAAEQSYRQFVPQVVGPIDKHAIKDYLSSVNVRLDIGDYQPLIGMNAKGDTTLWIGPEGGFSDYERQFASEQGFEIASLGPHVLRSETASLMAVVQARLKGEWI